MKKLLLAIIALLGMSLLSAEGMGMSKKSMKMPKNYRSVPFAKAQILQDGKSKIFCSKCGMTLPMFYKTNHAANVDGKIKQYCSLYCLVEEMSKKDVTDIKVVDNTTLKFIPVKDAWYVVGSSKPATMTAKVSKYAFGTQEDANKFAKEFGGKVMLFDKTLELAKESYLDDTKAKKMRQAKAAKRGEMIYKKMCKPIDKKFTSAAEAKSYIKANKVCGDIKGKSLQATALYLIRNSK